MWHFLGYTAISQKKRMGLARAATETPSSVPSETGPCLD